MSSPESALELSSANGTPRKRRRLDLLEPSRVRKYYLEGKYNDAYRLLFNDHVTRAAAPWEPHDADHHHHLTQYGASTWSAKEHASLFAALERLGKDDVAGIAHAVGTKTITETHALLLLLHDAATAKGDVGLTLRHVPAAVEIGRECNDELDVLAEALAWYQEQWDMAEEQKRYGDYWLITPALADDMEKAINGSSRAASTRPATPTESATPRTGPGIAGSCDRCRHHKIRCDRKLPCTNCARLKKQVVCEYKPSRRDARSLDPTPHSPKLEEHLPQPQPQILRAVPQTTLLHAQNMLTLSHDLFMNRSPDIPSPWPHWSAYASDQVPLPSMMRTAFNDFHTLAVSVTKRLMQAAMVQATSRLRSQRRRTKNGVMPFVKTRDVLSAIDILGLKRSGRSRWTRVARRCNVRVFDEQRTTRFKIKQREISWDQAEQILGLYDAASGASPAGPLSDEHAADSDQAAFQRRAARHGTPLPMEHLSLSNSASDIDLEDAASDSASVITAEEAGEVSDGMQSDSANQSSSPEPEHTPPNGMRDKQTLEHFDQEASRQEEEALCSRLELSIEMKLPSSIDGSEEDGQQRLFNKVDDWRNWTEYHAAWEEFETPVPTARFIANQKPRTMPAAHHQYLDSSASSTASGSPQQSRKTRLTAIELQPQNPRSYAAMQGGVYSLRDDAPSDEFDSSEEADADAPTRSIEDSAPAQGTSSPDAMDWER